jgi:hypothetical protein
MSNGATWLSGRVADPTEAQAPIIIDRQMRGGLRRISGQANDRLLDVPAQMLQNGMLCFLEAAYVEANGLARNANTYYQYTTNVARDPLGALPNAVGNWAEVNFGGGGGGGAGFINIANTLEMNNRMTGAGGFPALGAADDGLMFFVTDSTNIDASVATPGPNNPAPINAANVATAVTNLPVGAAAPQGGYGGDVRVVLSFDWNGGANAQRWIFQQFQRGNPDAAYVNVIGDTMTGTLTLNPTTATDAAIQVDAGHAVRLGRGSNLLLQSAAADNTFNTTVASASISDNRTVTFPDASGTVTVDPATPAATTQFVRQVTNAGVATWVQAQQQAGTAVMRVESLLNRTNAQGVTTDGQGDMLYDNDTNRLYICITSEPATPGGTDTANVYVQLVP